MVSVMDQGLSGRRQSHQIHQAQAELAHKLGLADSDSLAELVEQAVESMPLHFARVAADWAEVYQTRKPCNYQV